MNRNSEIIRILRFPLALLVVLLHAEPSIIGWSPRNMTTEYMGANVAGVVMYSLSHVLAQIAVPTFFVISGYLFFLKLDKWNYKVWKRKLVSRFSSILIPYIICIAVFSVKHIISHYQAHDITQWMTSQGGFFNLFWASEHWRGGDTNILGQSVIMTGPAAYHLWFLRDLLVVVLLTPIFYLLFSMKDGLRIKWAYLWLALLSILDLLRVQTTIPGVSCSTLFYFGLGVFLSLNRINLYDAFYRFRKLLTLLFIILFIFLVPLDGSRSHLGTIIMPLENLFGVMCVINWASFYTTTHLSAEIFKKYEKTSFFLFIIHPFFLAVVWRVLTSVITHASGISDINNITFVNSHPWMTLSLFFTKIAIAAALSVLTYHALTRISPKLSKLICGR